MENLTNNEQELEAPELEQGDSFEEKFLRQLVTGYEKAFNENNSKQEIKFELTITMHNIPRPEGNKDVAYLRLVRNVREKYDWTKAVETDKDMTPKEWSSMLVHQEIYIFKDMKERLSPRFREQLYMNCIARLVAGGLEYAELLKRMQQIEEGRKKAEESKLEVTKEMPKPLTEDEENYKKWLDNERKKEGL